MPEPCFGPCQDPDPDGWASIDRVGGWDSLLTQFTTLDQVPHQHRQAWTWAWGEVLGRLQRAEEGRQLDRALMWLCFLPQALLRQVRGGGRQGRGAVAMRFNAIAVEGNWGLLVTLWEKDMRKKREEDERERPRKVRSPEEEQESRRMAVKKLLANGQISRAVSRINSHGVADMRDPAVRAQLSAKYPEGEGEMPEELPKSSPIEHLRGLRETLLGLDKTTSPGTGGLRPKFLVTMAELMDANQMAQLEDFGLRYVRGDLPHWFYAVWLSVNTVPLFKTAEQTSIRPIGIRNPLLKALHKEVMKENGEELTRYLEQQQLVMSKAGGSKLVFSVPA